MTGTAGSIPSRRHLILDGVRRVLAVIAHPDDESFGLGALLDRLIGDGADAAVLCFTHGEASTLHGTAGDLAKIRPAELAAAGTVLGVGRTEVLAYPDGRLDAVPTAELAHHVLRLAADLRPTHLLVFDASGITGHPDHVRATAAALAAGRRADLPVLAWTLPQAVAEALNGEFGTRFAGRADPGISVAVDRTRQRRAIACHRSQSADNPVLWRRLEALGDREHVVLLRDRSGSPHHEQEPPSR